MRRGLLAVAATTIAVVIAVTAASGSASSARVVLHPLGNLAVKIPSAGQADMVLLTVKSAVSRGKLGGVAFKVTNESQLPSGVRAFGAVVAPRSLAQHATFQVYVGINDLGTAPTGASHRVEQPTDLELTTYLRITDFEGKMGEVHTSEKLSDLTIARDCKSIVQLGKLAEPPGRDVFRRIILTKLANEPASAAEAILDHVAYNECRAYGAELPEAGDGPE
ncbi:MAG TPA: hypothetical protein VKR79_06655 [Gaiellaceae bacterium]|nr:hypothetical protein [Gaiellaceae bacterium]